MTQRHLLWLIVGIAGLVLALLSFAGGWFTLALILAGARAPTAAETLPVAGMMIFGIGLGIPLALHGWEGWRKRPSRPFSPPRVWWMWLLLVLLIGLGAAVSSLSPLPALWLPPIHVLAMALPPLIVLGLVGRAVSGVGVSWREVVVGMAGGSTLGLGGSLVGEVLVAFAVAVVAVIVVLMTPDGAGQIAALVQNLRDPAWVTDLDNLLQWLLSPVVAFPVLVLFTIPIPLIEEVFKTLAAGVAARWARPNPARSLLWGVAGGAGFALAENLFNGALGGTEGWAPGAVARIGATAMHCFTSGLVGWGWGQFWTARRPLRLLGAYAAAVFIHGVWNAAAMGAVLLSVGALAHEGDKLWRASAGLGTLMSLGLLAVLTVVFLLALVAAGQRLAAGSDPLQEMAGGPEPASGLESREIVMS